MFLLVNRKSFGNITIFSYVVFLAKYSADCRVVILADNFYNLEIINMERNGYFPCDA
jgi:hypothetical protein